MNESNPALPPELTAVPAYKNRSTGLIIFGILTLLLGCLAGLFTMMTTVSLLKTSPAGAASGNHVSILLIMSLYGGLTVVLIWMGIGSIMARRWARALLLIFSWSWLVMGIFTTSTIPFVMAKTFANLPPNAKTGQPLIQPAVITGIIVGMVIFFVLFFVLLPTIWIFFYGSRHVKATCEARDPVVRWTDGCPLPVLGFCLWLLFSVPILLIMSMAGHSVMPFFGIFLTSLPSTLLYVLMAGLWAYAAWLLYKLDVRGWWLILIALLVFMVSQVLTYAHHDIIEMYQLMGYPQAEINQIQKMGLLTGNRMSWIISLCSLPFLGYLLFIKKYLSGKKL